MSNGSTPPVPATPVPANGAVTGDLAALPTPPPADRKLAYPWLSAQWLEDDYRQLRNRDQIERTEDILLGLRAGGRLGSRGSWSLRS